VVFSSEQLGVRHIYTNSKYALTKQNNIRTLSLPPHIQSKPILHQSSTTDAAHLYSTVLFDTVIIYSTNTTGGNGHGGNRKNSKETFISLESRQNFYGAVQISSTKITQWDPTSDDNICTAFVSNITLSQNNWPDDGM
jgi:hypothetical protein